MTPQGPLARRIEARKPKPEPIRRHPKPAWLERLTAKDLTGRLS